MGPGLVSNVPLCIMVDIHTKKSRNASWLWAGNVGLNTLDYTSDIEEGRRKVQEVADRPRAGWDGLYYTAGDTWNGLTNPGHAISGFVDTGAQLARQLHHNTFIAPADEAYRKEQLENRHNSNWNKSTKAVPDSLPPLGA